MTKQAEWERPVTLELKGIGQYRTINNAMEAVDCLMDGWPADEDDDYITAIQTCIAAMEGRLTPHMAREAFIQTARKARIYIKPDSLDDLRENPFGQLPPKH